MSVEGANWPIDLWDAWHSSYSSYVEWGSMQSCQWTPLYLYNDMTWYLFLRNAVEITQTYQTAQRQWPWQQKIFTYFACMVRLCVCVSNKYVEQPFQGIKTTAKTLSAGRKVFALWETIIRCTVQLAHLCVWTKAVSSCLRFGSLHVAAICCHRPCLPIALNHWHCCFWSSRKRFNCFRDPIWIAALNCRL